MSATTVTLEGATAGHPPGATCDSGGLAPAARRGLARMVCSFALTTMVGVLASCGGSSSPVAVTPPSAQSLTSTEVQQVLANAVAEAAARSRKATIAVVDRIGNVLAVYRTGSGSATPIPVLIASTLDANGNPTVQGGLEGIVLPVPGLDTVHIDDLAAIAKAVSGAYLSTAGHAFSTRTASQIIQSHFDPGQLGQPAGPLYGVQFSSLACSDFSRNVNTTAGPHRTPLGLSADPGGFPLYKNGQVVGGIGVISDDHVVTIAGTATNAGVYSVDNSATLDEQDDDEAIAYAGTYHFAAPDAIHADRITVGGLALRYSDINDYGSLATDPSKAADYSTLGAASGALVSTTGYYDATGGALAGRLFTQAESGVAADSGTYFSGQDAFVFVNADGTPRFAPADAAVPTGQALTQTEVNTVLSKALAVAARTRAQIRIPRGDAARVTIAVVDTQGNILGMVASPDAPIFGADVSVQKARSVTLLSSAGAADYLSLLPTAQYLSTITNDGTNPYLIQPAQSFAEHLVYFQGFVGNPTALNDGLVAYSERAIGNLSRPFYPDGIDGTDPGPLATPPGSGWSVFNDGVQLDLSINAIVQHVLYAAGAGTADVTPAGSLTGVGCAGFTLADAQNALVLSSPSAAITGNPLNGLLRDGLQIFAGGVPIYRGSQLVGAIGVSGDGTQQDDLVAFKGLADASTALSSAIGNAPASMRADQLTPQGARLLYVQCPANPFVDTNIQDACTGL